MTVNERKIHRARQVDAKLRRITGEASIRHAVQMLNPSDVVKLMRIHGRKPFVHTSQNVSELLKIYLPPQATMISRLLTR